MRKQVLVPENVEMADIHAIQTRVKKHNLLTAALLIPLFAGCALRESSETLGGIVFVLSIALMVLGFIPHTQYAHQPQAHNRYPSTYDKPIESIYRFSSRTIKHPFGVPHYPFPATGTTNLSYLG